MSVWDQTNVDWTTGEGLPVLQLFERAYADRDAARTVADAVGIGWPADARTLSHTELWVALLTTAAGSHQLPALAAELLDDPGRSHLIVKLVQALGDQVGLAYAARVAKRGLPQDPDKKAAVLAAMDVADATEAILPSNGGGRLEANNLGIRGSQDYESYLQAAINIGRRVMLLRQGLTHLGSGFLVGPDLLLTAAHVVRPDGPPRDTDIENLEAVLDFRSLGQAVADTGTPVPVAELLRASPATDAELLGGQLPNWDAGDDRLDYALLRLSRDVGNEPASGNGQGSRGWYTLSAIEPDILALRQEASQVLVAHFAEGKFLQCSPVLGTFTYNPAGTKTRLRYQSDTRPGSSGGPIVDWQGRLLAVHHYGLQPSNQAVPVWRIAEALYDLLGPGAAPLAPPRPIPPGTTPSGVLLVGNRPLVNRHSLKDKLWQAMTTAETAPSLVIVGTTDAGVTWSWWLLDHLQGVSRADPGFQAAVPRGVKAFRVDLREAIALPVAERRERLIRAVTKRLAPQTITDDWVAQVARQVSDFKDWCYERLPLEGAQWWIFVDSIDEAADIEQHGIGEVLAALVDLADDSLVNLRLVLAGRKADQLDHPSVGYADRDSAEGMLREEVKRWLEAMATKKGRVVDAEKLDTFLGEWFPTPDKAADRPVELTHALLEAVENVSA